MNRISALKQYLSEQPHDPFLLLSLASEYQKAGDFDNALHHFQRLITEHPAYIGTYYHLGKLYEHLGDSAKAISTYRTGIEHAINEGDQHAAGELRGALMFLEEDGN